MAYPSEQKDRTRRRVVESAGRLFRRYGYNGVGIDDIMAAANLTRGGFYAHFRSKEDLFAAVLAADLMMIDQLRSAADAEAPSAVRALIDFYLERDNRRHVPSVCSLASLSADVARAGDATRAAYTNALREMVDEMARRLPGSPEEKRTRAMAIVALCVGGVVLAQAIDDEQFAGAVLDACRSRARGEVDDGEGQ